MAKVSKTKKKTVKKVAKKKAPAKAVKKATKKAAPKKTVKKKAVKKTAAKKAVKKKVGKKAAPKKTAAKKAAKKKVSKKVAKKKVVKKPVKKTVKKAAVKKTTKKAPAKKVSKKASVKKPVAKKKPAKKTAKPKRPVSRSNRAADGPVVTPYQARKDENYMNKEQVQHFIDILTNWKKELMEEVDRTVHHMKDESHNLPDPSDRASQEEEFSLELRTRDRERKLIRKIDKTLESIQNDDYGYCEDCGVEIGIRRLEARPTATQCIDCKTLSEMKEKQTSL